MDNIKIELEHGCSVIKYEGTIDSFYSLSNTLINLFPKEKSTTPIEVSKKKEEFASPKSSDIKFGKLFNNGVYKVYVVSVDIPVNSFKDFVGEIPEGVAKVCCCNKNIRDWDGIGNLPKSVTNLDVSGSYFTSLQGELCLTNIQSLIINSCSLTSLKGINKTKIKELECTNNPYLHHEDSSTDTSNYLFSEITKIKKKYEAQESATQTTPS